MVALCTLPYSPNTSESRNQKGAFINWLQKGFIVLRLEIKVEKWLIDHITLIDLPIEHFSLIRSVLMKILNIKFHLSPSCIFNFKKVFVLGGQYSTATQNRLN